MDGSTVNHLADMANDEHEKRLSLAISIPEFGEIRVHYLKQRDFFQLSNQIGIFASVSDGLLDATGLRAMGAVRGPDGNIYPWGDAFDCSRGNFDDRTQLDDYVMPGRATSPLAQLSLGRYHGSPSVTPRGSTSISTLPGSWHNRNRYIVSQMHGKMVVSSVYAGETR